MNSVVHYPHKPDMPAPPLSAASRVGNLLFVSGTPGFYPGGRLDEHDFGLQFDQAMRNLQAALAEGGSSLQSVVKVNVLLTRAEDLAEMNRRYASVFGPAPYPARTTCVVAALPDSRMLLEIECVAEIGIAGR